MYRSAIARQARLFSTSVPFRKSAIDSAKEAAQAVDKTIAQAAVKGIEQGEKAAQAAKETVGMNTAEAEAKAKEASGEAKGKAHEVAGQVKGKAEEVKQKM